MVSRVVANLKGKRFAEVVRFGISGVATEVVYFAILWGASVCWDVPLWWQATVAYALSIVFNYFMQRTFTFRSTKSHAHSTPRFLGVHAVGMALNSVTLGIMVDWAGLPFLVSQAVAIGLVALWSYYGQRRWAF
jgi:putative flippase GtrA